MSFGLVILKKNKDVTSKKDLSVVVLEKNLKIS